MTRAIIPCIACCLSAVLWPAYANSKATFQVPRAVSGLHTADPGSEPLHRPFQFLKDGEQDQSGEQPSNECTFAESVSAMGTSCCQMPAPTPGAFEEYVCGGNPEIHTFIDRICTFPGDQNNPCGQVGANGCAICWTAPYTRDCVASSNSRNPKMCAYAFR